ncbi:MAG: FHA domain-containing protein [Anaerolineales bacterium]|jgi:ABC-type multidrug transport system ATPase subunit/pSer/pThr/pTyr-binding forkhead associated (FHA) protein/ABC-type multidrug transport system permease subunit|nr:FHA domain-containing protein [Anaerolineales bacterium]
MNSTLCPHCGAQNAAQARFCANCGKPLAPVAKPDVGNVCPRCQTPIRSTARFCPNCGYDIGQQFAATPAPVAVAAPAQQPAHAGAVSAPVTPPATTLLSDMPGTNTLIVRWMGGNTQRYPITVPTLRVGRAPDNDVVINHPAVSSHHLTLFISSGTMTVTDLKSTNGTQLNGQRIPPNSPQPINFGDVIRIGDLTGNWVTLGLESAAGEALRTLSLGKLDLSNLTSITIGRDPSAYLPLNHPTVSFHHAQIYKQNANLFIKDLDSTNGTFVNGQRIRQSPLNSGDEIQIGPFKLVYDAQNQSLAQSMRLGHRIDAIKLGREVANHKMILRDVSMTINPGEFVALVGGSGAGKSTLMKAMNGYEPANHGQMLLDAEPLYSKLDLYRTQMGYVPQDDIIHRTLPVRVALWYAAKLRLPDARPKEIEARIQEALRAVDMIEHADKPVRVLSGGQRKRVSIAVELLARPTLFFLDEPTSGLDPGLEKKMMYDLNRLADEGRTVVLVTHATANIEQCDHVAFLSQGRLSYYGPPNEALQFFNVRDFSDIYLKLSQEIDGAKGKPPPPELQPYYNPKPGAPTKTTAGVLWAEHYKRSPQFQKFVADRQSRLAGKGQAALAAAAPPPRSRSRDSFLRQTFILARRQFDLIRFDWRTLFILLLMMPLIAFLFMSVSEKQDLTGRPGTAEQIRVELEKEVDVLIKEWEKKPASERGKLEDYTEKNYTPVENAQTLVTMLALALTQGGTFIAAYEIVKERAIYRRERAVNLSAIAYVLSKIIILGIFALVQVASVLMIISLKVDTDLPGAIFKDAGVFEMFITLYLAVLASITFGLFVSAIVPNTDVVLYAILVQLFVQIILGGTLFPIDSKVASATTISYWTTDALGSTIDMKQLNNESWSCVGVETFDENTGAAVNKPMCSKADTDLSLDYQHTPEHILAMWRALIIHGMLWFIATVIVQARKKAE